MKPLQILLLTDFSAASKLAIKYAMNISHKLSAEYTIINVVKLDGVPHSSQKLLEIEKSLVSIANEEGGLLLSEVKGLARAGVKIEFKTLHAQTVAEAINSYAAKNFTSLVVMGSQGASSLKKFRLGGTTVSVIDTCKVPVMAIPSHAVYKEFSNVVYASDLKHIQQELDIIIPFAKIFGTRIHMVHVVPVTDKKVETQKTVVGEMLKQTGYKSIDFRILISQEVATAIDRYINETKSDLLTTFTHELTLYEKLFGLGITRKLAYQGNIPLLAFKRKN